MLTTWIFRCKATIDKAYEDAAKTSRSSLIKVSGVTAHQKRRYRPLGANALVALVVAMFCFVSGCSSVKRTLGFEKNPPDEFAVVSRDPLTLPPDFSLVPPTVRDTKKDSQRAQEAAKKALKQGGAYGSSAPVSAEDARRLKGNLQDGSQGPTAESKTFQTNRPSSLDAVLKKSRASVGDIAPEDLSMIRSQVDEEAGVYVEPEEKGIIERALFWQKKTKPTEKLVDPMLEKQRLSEAQKSQPEEATSVIVVTEESSVGG